MLTNEIINDLLGITESYQAPQKMLDKMLDDKERSEIFEAFLEHETDLNYEWFQAYFENEHSDRKQKKQDFTPNSVSELLARIADQGKIYHESTAGTGGIMIQHWKNQRAMTHPFLYDPKAYWYHVEELSDRSIPFLIFNMAIRGINGVALHGDSLTRTMKDVYFIRNESVDFMTYSEVIKMPKTDELKQELDIKEWI